jgi:hypothetical protein
MKVHRSYPCFIRVISENAAFAKAIISTPSHTLRFSALQQFTKPISSGGKKENNGLPKFGVEDFPKAASLKTT